MNALSSRTTLFWASAGGMFVVGIVLAILGALFGLPETRERLDINLAQQGNVFLLLFFGFFVCTFFAGPAVDGFGGPDGRYRLRFCFAKEMDVLEEACRRLRRCPDRILQVLGDARSDRLMSRGG